MKMNKESPHYQGVPQPDRKDIHIIQGDVTSTIMARATECCGGYYQTIAGALINSDEWRLWCDYATQNMLFEANVTQDKNVMSDEHFRAFIKFIKEKL